MTLEEVANESRKLANVLFKNDPVCCNQREGEFGTCLRLQCETNRAFIDYKPDQMCLGCRAYWFAELSAQSLEKLHALERRYGRKGGGS